MKYYVDNIIDSTSLSAEEWVNIFLNEDSNIFPDKRFPSDDLLDEYLEVIKELNDEEVRKVIRRMLVQTGNYGKDDNRLQYFECMEVNMPEYYEELVENASKTEYYRRLTSGIAWEGLTWVLDLLPESPYKAIKSIEYYLDANSCFLPESAWFGLYDAIAIIHTKYIQIEHPKKVLLSLKPIEFEWLVEKLYMSIGYETSLTPTTHDGGIDIIAERFQTGSREKLLIQCKRYKNHISVDEVWKLIGIVSDNKATKGLLVTSSYFSRDCRKIVENNSNVELIDGKQLVTLLNSHLGTNWVHRLQWIFASKRMELR